MLKTRMSGLGFMEMMWALLAIFVTIIALAYLVESKTYDEAIEKKQIIEASTKNAVPSVCGNKTNTCLNGEARDEPDAKNLNVWTCFDKNELLEICVAEK